MKFIFPITLITFFIFTSCETTSLTNGPDIEPPLIALSYDGPNNDAPLLPAASYEAATKFPQEDISDLLGDKLIEVYYYIEELPISATIKIYKGTDSEGPIELVYSEATTDDLVGKDWNKHILRSPVEITEEDLWISVKFTHREQSASIGCDIGPAIENGDWLLDSADDQWIPLTQRAGININWNIRGVIEPQ